METKPEVAGQQELVVQERREAMQITPAAATPADIVLYAMKNGGSIAEIREFMQLQREWEADQARKAFFEAKTKFHAEEIEITKDKENVQYKSKYTGIGNLVNTVKPFLSKHGLSADWTLDQTSGIKVTCVLTHSMGHSESVAFTVPPDTSGAKNPIQQLRSAVTYARSTTFEMVCGIASSDENCDDDGNTAGEMRKMAADMKKPTEQAPAKHLIDGPTLKRALEAIKAHDYTYDELVAYYGLTPEQDEHARLALGMEAAS